MAGVGRVHDIFTPGFIFTPRAVAAAPRGVFRRTPNAERCCTTAAANHMSAEERTENPLEANSGEPAGLDIEAALKTGTLTEAQAIVQQEKMRQEMQAEIDELKARLSGLTAPLETAIRSVVARLTESPSNWHQGVVLGFVTDAPTDAQLRQWAPLGYLVSCVIVFMQSAVAVGICIGTIQPACANSDQCDPGMFCMIERARCNFCGDRVPLALETEGSCISGGSDAYGREITVKDPACTTRNLPTDPNFAGFNSTGVVAVCADPSLSYDPDKLMVGENVLSWCDAWCETLSLSLTFIS